jgi:hypothetical protein
MLAVDVAARHYRTQQQLAAKASTAARHLWAQMHPDNFDRSWEAIGPKMRALLTLAQARAAVDGVAYVADVLAVQGVTDDPVGDVDASKLAGVASSGGDIEALLYGPVIAAKMSVGQGLNAVMALQQARGVLDGIMLTQVADAGRVATGTATVARPHVPGYVRMLVGPSCSRCVVQAGKRFKWNRGFLRHPRCDCVHIPAVEDTYANPTTDPLGYFHSLTAADQESAFGKAGAQAIRDGADVGQVVNSRKGLATASQGGRKLSTTTQGTAKRTLRLMPEQIYKDAASRDDAIRLLRLFGYMHVARTCSPPRGWGEQEGVRRDGRRRHQHNRHR